MTGTLFIVSAPSGAGKTSLVRELLLRDRQIQLSVSHTTRPPRPGELHGREYHFVGIETFEQMRDRGDFIESAEVHGNLYGTSRAWLTQQIADGRDVVLEIDWQGAKQVLRIFPDAVGIFILPPSAAILEQRLRGRGTDAEEVIQRRLRASLSEMSHVDEFDYVIINKELHEAAEDLLVIVRASRLRCATQRARNAELFLSLSRKE